MLRAITNIYIEGHSIARKDVFKLFRVCSYSSAATGAQTVLRHNSKKTVDSNTTVNLKIDSGGAGGAPPPSPPPPPKSPRTWSALAAFALTASLGGVYYYRKILDETEDKIVPETTSKDKIGEEIGDEEEEPIPASADELPAHVQYLLVGGGTASFAAMRALRSARPDAAVLIAAAERALPYMRPPLSKELWREPALAAPPDALSFRQWNGRRRPLAYEPAAFYAPPGAALARGWHVARLDPARRVALLCAGARQHELTYDKVLLATGARPRRLPALRAAAAAGRALALRDLRDARRLAAALDAGAATVAVVGGGLLACELAAALAERLGQRGRVLMLFREDAPLSRLLPAYLARDAARRLAAAGVELRARADVVDAEVDAQQVALRLADESRLRADVVVECAGSEPVAELAAAAGLELSAELGGVVVNAELAARSGVYAAGDVACFYDPALGRRRVEHHDHAVVTGRLAGENMAAVAPPKTYMHQSMFWSDVGSQFGYEAIGIIDSRLQTVGVFSADAVADAAGAAREAARGGGGAVSGVAAAGTRAAVEAARGGGGTVSGVAAAGTRAAVEAARGGGGAVSGVAAARTGAAGEAGDPPRRYERGVVFYLRDGRVVGVLLWNLFNRMQVARQVLAQGVFEDLFEVAKLFSPHEED